MALNPRPYECEVCGAKEGLEWESSRTMYHWDGEGEDPNQDVLLCRECAWMHHINWDARWDDYFSGLM